MDASDFVQRGQIGAAQYRSWVRTGALAIMVAYAVSLVAHATLDDPALAGYVWRLLPEVAALLASGAAMASLARGHTRAAGIVVLAALWLELHASAMLDGRFLGVGIVALPVLTVGSGMFVGGTGAMAVAAGSAVSWPLAVQAGSLLFDTGPGVTGDNAYHVVILTLVLLATGWIVRNGLAAYGEVLGAAQAVAARYGSVVEHAPSGVVLLDDDGRVVTANTSAARLLDTPPDALRGRLLAELLGVDTARLVAGMADELTLHGPAGTQHIDLVSVPQPDAGGAQVMLRDQTARRAMEAQTTQLGRLLDDVLSEVYVVDAATLRFRFVNRGARSNLGYPPDELASREATAVNPGLTRARVAEFLRDARRRPDEAAGARSRGTHIRRDGSVYPVEIQLSPGVYEGAEVVIVFALDVTDRVEAEREHEHLQHQLRHAHRLEAVGQLAAGVAHEVNNVLLAIGAHLRILEEDSADPALIQEVRALRVAQQRGEAITRRLSAFARRDLRQAGPFAVDELIDEVRPLLTGMLGERHQLVVEREGPARVMADQGQVEQILVQLIMNARDAMPDGGTVRVVVGATDEDAGTPAMVAVDVRDTGVGMDEETKRRIFEPFFSTKTGGGSGLGLTVVEALAARNEGNVDVRSRPGWGTRVRLRLPAAPTEPASAAPPAGPPRPGGRLLLVEDDEGARSALKRLLERGGYDVVGAGTVRAALAAAGNADVLITDVALPDGSGLDLVRQVRATRPTLPVLLITGHIDPEVPADGFDPTKDLLIKPFASSLLLRRVAEVLRR